MQRLLAESGRQHEYRWMYYRCQAHGIKVRKEDVRVMLACLNTTGCELHQARHLHRRTYFAKDPNYLWHFDGYDKLKPFEFVSVDV